jgi:hypothetical protein
MSRSVWPKKRCTALFRGTGCHKFCNAQAELRCHYRDSSRGGGLIKAENAQPSPPSWSGDPPALMKRRYGNLAARQSLALPL